MNLEYLKRLSLRLRRGMGDRPGDRRFPGRPQAAGIEIEAHSAYVPGDDLRHLDWNAVGRLDTLLVRRFTAEREVVVHLLVDASASMAVPARDGKLALARELALALAYVALGANDAVRIAVLPGDGATRVSPLLRQRGSLGRAAALLAGRPHITFEDVERVALPALRHRLVMSYLAEAAGVDAAQVVEGVLAAARRARA